MDPNSGHIYTVTDDEEARRRGLVPIPKQDLERVRRMPMPKRIEWAETQMQLRVHRLARDAQETDAEYRKRKNAMKRERRARAA